jgi:heptosyltransferase I
MGVVITAMPAKSPRIAVVRLSAIGDCIHTAPVAAALREHFPDAFLSWVVEKPGGELLRGHEALDEVVVLPRGWLKSPRIVWQLRRQLRAMRLDVAIDAQGLTKSALAAWLSGAPRRIGYGGRWARELSPWLNTERVDPGDGHAVDRSLGLLRPLGIETPAVHFQLPQHAADRAAAEAILRQTNLSGKFALISVGAGWPSKVWPADRFAEVAKHLGSVHGMPTLVLWGNPAERGRAEHIVATAAGHAVLAPKMTLPVLAAVARRAALFLGCDTGPMHLAAAVATPCVALYGPWPAEKHAPYGPQHVTVQKMCCEGTTRQRRRASSIYMEAISVADVCAACVQVLQRGVSR